MTTERLIVTHERLEGIFTYNIACSGYICSHMRTIEYPGWAGLIPINTSATRTTLVIHMPARRT